jgi:hypothetical protein
MRRIIGCLIGLCLAAACSSSNSTFTLASAAVDPTYFCPGGANNTSYDLHATIKARNTTTSAVTIKAVTAEMTLAAVQGEWLEKVGDRYDAGEANFSPTQVAPNATTEVKVVIKSACTSGKYGTGVSSSGDYRVDLHVTTSAGTFSIPAANEHEIVAA